MKNLFKKNIIYIICGHYGVGKTNIAVNMANEIEKSDLTLIDLDIVNPFFRSADNKRELEERGVRVITPIYANTNVDIPSIPADINSVFENDKGAIFDVGGDDAGAVALCSFAEGFKRRTYEMYYVINMCRPQIENPPDAAALMYEIEKVSRLKFQALINNTNLGVETDRKVVIEGMEYAKNVAEITGLDVVATTVEKKLENKFSEQEKESIIFINDITKHRYC